MEPDRRYGYAYLKTTYDVAKIFDKKKLIHLNNQVLEQKHRLAVVCHIHYIELWCDVAGYLRNFGSIGFDLYITTTNSDIIETIKQKYPDSYVMLVENRGRDILPFIETLRLIHSFQYDAICKVHTKRSEYRSDGNELRDSIYNSLLGSNEKIQHVIDLFNRDQHLGIATAERFNIPHTHHNMTFDTDIVERIAKKMNVKFKYSTFPAGSMFWFRQAALSRLLLLDGSHFSLEKGLADGTTAHGVERLFLVAASDIGYKTITI